MIPFPLTEVYISILVWNWRVKELWRKDGEIRLCCYRYNQDVEDFVVRSGLEWEDAAINQLQHLEYSIYDSEEGYQ